MSDTPYITTSNGLESVQPPERQCKAHVTVMLMGSGTPAQLADEMETKWEHEIKTAGNDKWVDLHRTFHVLAVDEEDAKEEVESRARNVLTADLPADWEIVGVEVKVEWDDNEKGATE